MQDVYKRQTYDDLATVEGLTAAAEKYYNWTDAQTEAPDDGRALFGRDAMANYLLIGAKELGCTIFDVQNGKMTLDFDKNVIRKLWDNYYVPLIKGYFEATGHFRSDDIKKMCIRDRGKGGRHHSQSDQRGMCTSSD